jgi:DNA-binding FadR family transcriptional regulator
MTMMADDPAAVPRTRRGYGGHADSLREEIKQLLLDLQLRPGDTIPSEAALIERLGVSRGSLREALKSLQALGILETRHGSGTFVSSLSFEALADGLVFHMKIGGADDLTTIAELADIREILETSLVQRVAGALDAAQLAELDEIVDQMQAQLGRGSFGELDDLDRAFHSALYAGLHRALVNELLEAFWRGLAAARPSLPATSVSDEMVEKHRAIVEAIRSGDPDRAAEAMRDHFSGTRTWIGRHPA